MPRIPTYDNTRVTPNTLPQVRFEGVPDVAGPQAQQIGQGLMQAGSAAGRVALDLQQQANQLRQTDALNQLKEQALRLTYDKDEGYANLKGIDALQRPDGKPLEVEYGDRLQKVADDIAATLGNDAQRQAFAQGANSILSSFRSGILKHESSEFQTYALSVSEGVQATAMREISLSWHDPEAIDKAVLRVKSEVYRQAELLGKSAEWQEAQARKMTSRAHKTALAAALEHGDVMYADRYLSKYADQMEADDILQVRGIITKEVDLRVGTTVATDVFAQFAPRIAASDFDRLSNIVIGIESGGRRYDESGNLLESPKGAKGEMQVLDSTNSAPGFGVRPAADDSPEERARVGRDYLQAMVRRYDGDLAKTLAAYNWGPKNVDKAIKEHGDDWLTHAPRETQDYVARGTADFGAGAGAPPRPTLAEMKAALRQRPELAGNPQRLKHAEDRLEADYKDATAAIKQREEEVLDSVYRALYANGGDMAGLPPGLRAAIPGDKLGTVLEFARKVVKDGGVVNNPEAWAQILSLPKSELAKMSPAEFYRRYRPALDDAHLEKGYALLNDAQGKVGDASHLEIITTANRVKQGAIKAGIIPADGKLDEDEVLAFAQYAQLVDERVRQFEQIDLEGKRKANSAELQKIIDEVDLDRAFVPRTFWFDREQPVALMSPEDQARAYVTVGDEEIVLASIPQGQRAMIVSKLRARGLPVTEQAVAELWVRAGKPQ